MSYIVRLHIFQLFFTAKYQIKATACPMVAIAKRTTISGAVTISAPFRPWRRRQETEVRHVLLAAHRSTRYAPVQYTGLAGRSEGAGGCTTELLRGARATSDSFTNPVQQNASNSFETCKVREVRIVGVENRSVITLHCRRLCNRAQCPKSAIGSGPNRECSFTAAWLDCISARDAPEN